MSGAAAAGVRLMVAAFEHAWSGVCKQVCKAAGERTDVRTCIPLTSSRMTSIF